MRITAYKSLYQLSYLPKLFPVNVYVVEESSSLTLIDTGLPPMVPQLLKFSKKIGKPIDKVLLTHVHSDHIGGLEKLMKALPEVQVIVPKRESRFLMGDFTLDAHEPKSPLKGGYPKQPMAVFSHTIESGDAIGSLTAISVPGHTPGLTAYWHENDKYLIVGDAMQTQGGLAIAGVTNWSFPFPAMATWSKALAIESAEKLQAFPADVIGAGHGDLLFEPAQKLAAAIEMAKSK